MAIDHVKKISAIRFLNKLGINDKNLRATKLKRQTKERKVQARRLCSMVPVSNSHETKSESRMMTRVALHLEYEI